MMMMMMITVVMLITKNITVGFLKKESGRFIPFIDGLYNGEYFLMLCLYGQHATTIIDNKHQLLDIDFRHG